MLKLDIAVELILCLQVFLAMIYCFNHFFLAHPENFRCLIHSKAIAYQKARTHTSYHHYYEAISKFRKKSLKSVCTVCQCFGVLNKIMLLLQSNYKARTKHLLFLFYIIRLCLKHALEELLYFIKKMFVFLSKTLLYFDYFCHVL